MYKESYMATMADGMAIEGGLPLSLPYVNLVKDSEGNFDSGYVTIPPAADVGQGEHELSYYIEFTAVFKASSATLSKSVGTSMYVHVQPAGVEIEFPSYIGGGYSGSFEVKMSVVVPITSSFTVTQTIVPKLRIGPGFYDIGFLSSDSTLLVVKL